MNGSFQSPIGTSKTNPLPPRTSPPFKGGREGLQSWPDVSVGRPEKHRNRGSRETPSTMAYLHGIATKMFGSVGQFTFKRLGGATIVSEKGTNMTNRVRPANRASARSGVTWFASTEVSCPCWIWLSRIRLLAWATTTCLSSWTWPLL